MSRKHTEHSSSEPGNPSGLPRREWIKGTLGLGALAALPGCAALGERAPSDLVRRENQKPGTRDWMLKNTRIDPVTKYRCPWIEGYCSHTSVRAGENIQFFVSTNPASSFTIDVYRMGFYGGTGGRHLTTLGPFPGAVQPDPSVGTKRLRDCQWEPCATLKIPSDWPSGVYLGKLTAELEGLQSYVIFIVRDDRRADLIFQCSDHTWQAYNRWPSQFSIYDNGEHEWWWGGDVQISFNRPYGKYCQILDAPLSTGSGEWFLWEFPFAYWLEAEGYDVTYISNCDTHSDPGGLLRAKGFLSVGHDEYYSIEMFRHLQTSIDRGLSIGFFSGNAVFGRIELSPDRRGNPHRVIERVGVFGPPGGTAEFEAMKTLAHERPYGNELMGAHTTGPVIGGADWVCAKPDHWVFAGTGMKWGEGIPGLVGWEWHGDPAKIPGLEIVATAPTKFDGKPNGGQFTATVYPGPRGNIVFNAATCWWADGLSAPPGYVRPSASSKPLGPDARAQQITRNVLGRMIGLH